MAAANVDSERGFLDYLPIADEDNNFINSGNRRAAPAVARGPSAERRIFFFLLPGTYSSARAAHLGNVTGLLPAVPDGTWRVGYT